MPAIGKYGRMRLRYLKKYHNVIYTGMLLTGKLNDHLIETDRSANQMMFSQMEQMAKISLVICACMMVFRALCKLRLRIPLLYVLAASISTFFTDWMNVHESLVLFGLFILLGLTAISWVVTLIRKICN